MSARARALACCSITPLLLCILSSSAPAALPAGNYVVLGWNDLGMHCMNQSHANLSVLPPYNNLFVQIIHRGDAYTMPMILTQDATVEYSIPGNTWSAGKTDFWTYAEHLFGVALPPDVGLTGKGLSGTMDFHADHFSAEGVPLTPYADAAPTVEDPYQQALVVLRDSNGIELARSRPVMPVSVEMRCVSTGCHASESALLLQHAGPGEGGFDVADKPILCAACHGDPALGTVGPGAAGYFSQRIHEKHAFIDEFIPGMSGCYKCHPGQSARCLRGTMNSDFGLVCQDCHGGMHQVADSIDGGRVPWVDEPACRTCHTAAYGEPVGQLYKVSRGHGGVFCEACHNSTHAEFPTREPRDNQVMIDLQGHAGTLSDCRVCHGVYPSGPGPHGMVASGVVEAELLDGAGRLAVWPSPLSRGESCTIRLAAAQPQDGRLLVFDARGRTVRLLELQPDKSGEAIARWDGLDGQGRRVGSGVYFLRWSDGREAAAAKVVMVN
jgi:hypothetical protein